MNVDTNDGNVLKYTNNDFWEHATKLGGATDVPSKSLTQDFKNATLFNSIPVSEILIAVHDEGRALGWRSWSLTSSSKTLMAYFTEANTCINGGRVAPSKSVHLASGSLGSAVGTLDPHEPLVVNTAGGGSSGHTTNDLWVNAGGDNDYNRLSTTKHPRGNYGYGLGTMYDQTSCETATKRPQADAELHVDAQHWQRGLVGSDHECHGGCPWTTSSGLNYDYAIYVKAS